MHTAGEVSESTTGTGGCTESAKLEEKWWVISRLDNKNLHLRWVHV